MPSDAFLHPRFGADGVFFYFCRQNRLFMTQKEAIIEALKRLGGKAKMGEICKLAREIGDFSGSKAPDNTIRNCIYMNSRDFRPSEQKGWWELVSYQEEIACRDKRIKELEEENERLRSVPTEDAFVKRFVKETKHFFKHDRKKADIIRQIMIKLGRTNEDLDLDAWIEGNERQNAKIVVQGNYNDIHNNGTVNNKG